MEAKMESLERGMKKLPGDLGRLKESVAFTVNPNRERVKLKLKLATASATTSD